MHVQLKHCQPGELRLTVSGFFLLSLSPSPVGRTERDAVEMRASPGVKDVTFNTSSHCSVSALEGTRATYYGKCTSTP